MVKMTEVEQVSIGMKNMAGVNGAVFTGFALSASVVAGWLSMRVEGFSRFAVILSFS
jgi:hypothetical protein